MTPSPRCSHEPVCEHLTHEWPDYGCEKKDCQFDTRRNPNSPAALMNETQMMRDRRLVYFGKEAQLRELICYVYPDSDAGFVIRERLDKLIENGSNAEIFSNEHNAAIRNQTLDEIHKKQRKKFTLATKEIDEFFESLRTNYPEFPESSHKTPAPAAPEHDDTYWQELLKIEIKNCRSCDNCIPIGKRKPSCRISDGRFNTKEDCCATRSGNTGCPVSLRIKRLREQDVRDATIRNQTLDAAIKRINKTLAVNWTPHRAGLEKAREVIKSLRTQKENA